MCTKPEVIWPLLRLPLHGVNLLLLLLLPPLLLLLLLLLRFSASLPRATLLLPESAGAAQSRASGRFDSSRGGATLAARRPSATSEPGNGEE
jgi:hypothetical protein